MRGGSRQGIGFVGVSHRNLSPTVVTRSRYLLKIDRLESDYKAGLPKDDILQR